MVPKQEEQSRSGGLSGQSMTLISRPGCGDRLGLKRRWECKVAGGRSTRPGTRIPECCADKDCGQGLWARTLAKSTSQAGKRSPARHLLDLSHTALSQRLHPRFSHTVPEPVMSTQSQSVGSGKRLQNLLIHSAAWS